MDIKEQLFQRWITENWKEEYHNFSKKADGEYWYYPMSDAWGVWQGAFEVMNDNKKTKG